MICHCVCQVASIDPTKPNKPIQKKMYIHKNVKIRNERNRSAALYLDSRVCIIDLAALKSSKSRIGQLWNRR